MKKTLSLIVALFVIGMSMGTSAFAALEPSEGDCFKTIGTGNLPISITAIGTLSFSSDFSATVVGGSSLDFNSTGSLVKRADEVVKLEFNASDPVYKAIIVSTNNDTLVTTDDGPLALSGLVGADKKKNAPLHWAVFPTESEATSHSFATFTETVKDEEGNVIEPKGYVNSKIYPYVVDRGQLGDDGTVTGDNGFDTPEVLGYASVLYAIEGEDAKLANTPEAGEGTYSPEEDNPNTPDVDETTLVLPNPRTVDNGTAYVAFVADFHNCTSQEYKAKELTFDLVTID